MQYRIELEGKDKFFRQGVELVNQNKNQEAIQKFKKSLKKNPHHAPVYRNLAYLHFTSKQYNNVVKVVDKAIKQGIKDASILHYKGYALKLLNNPEEAINALKISLEYDPQDTDTILLLGNTHRMLKQYDQALKHYDAGLSLEPTYDLIRGNKLSVLKLKGDTEGFEKFKKESANFYHDKALKYQSKDKYLTSLIFYRKALRYYDIPDAKDNINSVLNILVENPDQYPEYDFKFFDLNNWKEKGLVFLDLGEVDNVAISVIEKKLISFRSQQEIPYDNLIMIPFNVIGMNKTLIGIEFIPGAFKKFNSIYRLPFFKIEYPELRIAAYYPTQVESMKDLMKEFGIQPIKLSIWDDPSLTFYRLGPLSLKLNESFERIHIIINYLRVDLNLFKMFPLQDTLVAAIEKYPGAYLPFEKKTGLKPITIKSKK